MSGTIKIVMGGSPCTHWSIAQTKNRETEPSGLGWELFKNYKLAIERYAPDFFLYENNKSMAPAIRAQITEELGVEPTLINSALVSAQNRQRLYWVGRRLPDGTYSQVEIEQPEDLGILLRDILESGVCWRDKSYTLKANYTNAGAVNGVCGQHFPAPMAGEPVNITTEGKAQCLRATYYKDGIRNMVGNTVDRKTCVAEPVRVGDMPNAAGGISGSQSGRIYSVDGKGVPLQARPNGGGADGAATGLYAVPCAGRMVGRRINEAGHRDDYNESIERFQRFEVNENPDKTNCLSTVEKDNMVAIPAGIAWRGRGDSSAYEVRNDQKSNVISAEGHQSRLVIEAADGKTYPVYEVRGGYITIKGKQYPIKLADGFYIIRKLTVTECKRLQTVPDEYIFPVSNSQAYKMLGNGWTVDVIAHIMGHFDGITTEPVEVLSMYDGMSCGHIALDKLGANVVRYHATEIDKYAVQTTTANYPDTVQLGDAFQIRDLAWDAGGIIETESTDLSDAPEEIKQQILDNDKRLSERDGAREAIPNG